MGRIAPPRCFRPTIGGSKDRLGVQPSTSTYPAGGTDLCPSNADICQISVDSCIIKSQYTGSTMCSWGRKDMKRVCPFEIGVIREAPYGTLSAYTNTLARLLGTTFGTGQRLIGESPRPVQSTVGMAIMLYNRKVCTRLTMAMDACFLHSLFSMRATYSSVTQSMQFPKGCRMLPSRHHRRPFNQPLLFS